MKATDWVCRVGTRTGEKWSESMTRLFFFLGEQEGEERVYEVCGEMERFEEGDGECKYLIHPPGDAGE